MAEVSPQLLQESDLVASTPLDLPADLDIPEPTMYECLPWHIHEPDAATHIYPQLKKTTPDLSFETAAL